MLYFQALTFMHTASLRPGLSDHLDIQMLACRKVLPEQAISLRIHVPSGIAASFLRDFCIFVNLASRVVQIVRGWLFVLFWKQDVGKGPYQRLSLRHQDCRPAWRRHGRAARLSLTLPDLAEPTGARRQRRMVRVREVI